MSRAVLSTTALVASIKRKSYSTSAAAAAKIESRARPMDSSPSATSNPKSSSAASSSWVPDPVTGYYRPGNRHMEMDAAKMRETQLSHDNTEH